MNSYLGASILRELEEISSRKLFPRTVDGSSCAGKQFSRRNSKWFSQYRGTQCTKSISDANIRYPYWFKVIKYLYNTIPEVLVWNYLLLQDLRCWNNILLTVLAETEKDSHRSRHLGISRLCMYGLYYSMTVLPCRFPLTLGLPLLFFKTTYVEFSGTITKTTNYNTNHPRKVGLADT